MQKPVVTTQEFSLRIPKLPNKKYEIMKFNSNLNIDFGKWIHAKIERDVVKVDGKIEEEDMPKFGAGSEFGREARQEARKRRYGGNKKVSESSPWILKVGGKKFRGVREGGITDNSSYYVFTHGSDGIINAHKLEEWYNFQPVQRYKTLSAEEAEEEFGRRNKVMNHFNLMLQKRLKNEEDEEIDEEEKGKGKKGAKNRKSKELKISEMDDWVDSEDEESDDDEQDEEKVESKKKQKLKNKNQPKSKKKSKGSDESAFEESDDGDEEGRELDYISDSSDEVSDDEAKVTKEMQGVSEEKALKSLLTSDEDEDEDEEQKEKNKEIANNTDVEEEDKAKKEENKPKQATPSKKKKKQSDKKSKKESDTDSDSSVDSSDIENEMLKKRPLSSDGNKETNVDQLSTSSNNLSAEPAKKKLKLEFSALTMPDTHGITEEAVRRYLSRKPITTTQLVSKFKNRSNLSSDQLVSIIALLLKKINPERKNIKNKMYLSLKHV
ncbi:general transcription factor IIF subunit 1 [Daktulosphaira vitifoliae]|uniref:general transcription factor IIF subunit 1 n=1 Tax=Daktulosphaira vitifoliae TaxID=58002 RepID=UPI0021A9C1CD|nr:general transcription factor IIF subunit 1 [Daktulosphaira vitifoliae]